MDKKTSNKTLIVNRLKIAEGHLRKVREMVEKDVYCIDILHQLQAVEAALKETDSQILQNHLNTCVVKAIKEGKARQVIKEIMAVFRKSNK